MSLTTEPARGGRHPGDGLQAAPVRAAIAGAGLMGRWHASELARAGGVLVGVTDGAPEAARRLASRYSTSTAFDDLDRLLAEARPEVLHICTPLGSHVELAERGLRAGIHVLIEKPLAPDAGSTEHLLALAAARRLILCPVHQLLFQRGTLRAQRALARLGPPLHSDATACSAGGTGRDDRALDDLVAEILPHPLAVLQRLLPGGIESAEWRVLRPAAGELRAVAAADPGTVSVCVSLGGRPTCHGLRVVGARGTVHVDFFHGFGFVEGGGVSRARKILHPFTLAGRLAGSAAANLSLRAVRREPAYPGLRSLIARLYGAIRTGEASPISPAEVLAVARTRDCLLLARDAGSP